MSSKDIIAISSQVVGILSTIIIFPFIIVLYSFDDLAFFYFIYAIFNVIIIADFGTINYLTITLAKYCGENQENTLLSDKHLSLSQRLNNEAKEIIIRYLSLVKLIILILFVIASVIFYLRNSIEAFADFSSGYVALLLFTLTSAGGLMLLSNLIVSVFRATGQQYQVNLALIWSRLIYLIIFIFGAYLGFTIYNFLVAIVVQFFIIFFFLIFKEHRRDIFIVLRLITKRLEFYEIPDIERKNVLRTIGVTLGGLVSTRIILLISVSLLPEKQYIQLSMLTQLFGAVITVSSWYFYNSQHLLVKYFSIRDIRKACDLHIKSMRIFYLFYGLISLLIYIGFNSVLALIGRADLIISPLVILIYFIVHFLGSNHTMFSVLVACNEEVPFLKSALIEGFLVMLVTFLCYNYFRADMMLGIIIVGIVQLSFANWFWPYYGLQKLNLSFTAYLKRLF